jgi:signal transduction histidine kinase/ActR/RegA family two-component response regulator
MNEEHQPAEKRVPSADDSARACEVLRQVNAALTRRVDELERVNLDSRRTRLATLNALEDAVASRGLAEALNEQLQTENAERRRIERELRENKLRLETALDAARAAYQAKDHFIAALSHELRTPLAPILLAASLGARDESLPPHARTNFELVRSNVEVEARLIDDLLDQGGIARGRPRLTRTLLDLHDVLEQALRTTAAEFEEKKIVLQLDFRAKATGVDGDAVRLQQIFWNLLRNAAKFTPPRGTVAIRTRDLEHERMEVSITDNGIGLTDAEAQRIFAPFAQGDHALADSGRNFGGLGLGLAISKELAELHGGSLKVSSAGRGHGATFTVELPASGCPVTKAANGNLRAGIDAPNARGLRILLVEDHPATRNVLSALLKQKGHGVVAAGSVAEGLRLAEGARPDLLISDLGLPDGTGWKLMNDLRAQHPRLAGIALSGYGMDSDLQRTHEAGFAAHLIKPVSLERLDAALQQVALTPALRESDGES